MSALATYPIDELKQLEAQAGLEEQRAQREVVNTEDDYERVCNEMVRLKTLIQAAEDRFNPIVAAANNAHKEACKQRGLVIDPLQRALNFLRPKVGAFLQRKRDAEEAERRRLLEEAKQRAAAEREHEIEQAEAQNATPEEVQALCEMPLPVTQLPSVRRTVATGPVSARDNYRGVVTNKLALVQFVAKNSQYLNLLSVNESAVNQMARSLKTAMRIPGIEVVNEAITATRTAARRTER